MFLYDTVCVNYPKFPINSRKFSLSFQLSLGFWKVSGNLPEIFHPIHDYMFSCIISAATHYDIAARI